MYIQLAQDNTSYSYSSINDKVLKVATLHKQPVCNLNRVNSNKYHCTHYRILSLEGNVLHYHCITIYNHATCSAAT